MKKLLQSHTGYYFSLGFMLLVCFGLIVYYASQPVWQMAVLIFAAFLYAVWGIAHHFAHHDISAKIVIEYVLIAALGMTLALLVIK